MNQEVRQRDERDLEDQVFQEETRMFGEERQKLDQKKLKDLSRELPIVSNVCGVLPLLWLCSSVAELPI